MHTQNDKHHRQRGGSKKRLYAREHNQKKAENRVLRASVCGRQDISDLFGADLPVEGGGAGQFAWRDGPLLRALREGHWVLLDEVSSGPEPGFL